MSSYSGTTIAVVIVVIIIILIILAVACGGCGGFSFFGCGSSSKLPKCLKACRFCAEADSNQIQLGPCCIAKITNKVGQATTYTIPDPGTGGTASFLLDTTTTAPTVNGLPIVLATDGTVTQLTSLATGVTLDGTSGAITTFTATPLLATGASATFTVTNSAVTADSQILLTVAGNSGGVGLPGAYVTNVVDGSFDIVVYNASAASAVNGNLLINFLVLP